MTNKVKVKQFPMKCRTPQMRDRLLQHVGAAVRESVAALVRSQQYWELDVVAANTAFQVVTAKGEAVAVEVGTELGQRGSFMVKVWVNGRETPLARLHASIRAAFDGDIEEDDEP